jgi:hypothetical protein
MIKAEPLPDWIEEVFTSFDDEPSRRGDNSLVPERRGRRFGPFSSETGLDW